MRQDRDSEGIRPLESYLAEFPGDAEALAEEYLEIKREDHGPRDRQGDCVGPYLLIRELGRGGQAIVHLAEDTRLRGRLVALKVLQQHSLFTEGALERFRREAEVAAKLHHPGICTVYEAGIDRGLPYIAMRYVEGETLAARVRSSEATVITGSSAPGSPPAEGAAEADTRPMPLTEETARPDRPQIDGLLELIEAAARTLHAAHEAGIIHRDIKPGNIMITRDGDPVIMDFGLAREVEGQSLTLQGQFFGTPAYMSPEQLLAHRIHLDRRTDVWSLGITLFECLTLELPFDAPTHEGLYQAIQSKDCPNPCAINSAIPSDLRWVLETALDKDRDRRYRSALELAEDLRRVRRREPITARPVTRTMRLRRWSERNPALASSLFGGLIILFAGLVTTLTLLAQRDEALGRGRETRKELKQKVAELDRYFQISGPILLRQLIADAEGLWPPRPAMLPAFQDWLETARQIEQRLPRDAGDGPGPERGSSHPSVEGAAPLPAAGNGSRAAAVRAAETRDAIREFRQLIQVIEARRTLTRAIKKISLEDHRAAWDRCRSRLASHSAYAAAPGGLKLKPTIGLVPLGVDRDSGLWEFWHVDSGARPRWEGPDWTDGDAVTPAGKAVIAPESGIVMVLLPGGRFTMGAGATPDAPGYDPAATSDERPAHQVTLAPFLLAKHEVTQAQWLRIMDHNPSRHAAGATDRRGRPISPLHPVTDVDWMQCREVLRRWDLELPTEARWEYACRAGTRTRFWSGADLASILAASAGNVSDAKTRSSLSAFDDGYLLHAPVDTFAPNAFGLHHVLGNVWEWCADRKASYARRPRAGDGLRDDPDAGDRIVRGGSYDTRADDCGSAIRYPNGPTFFDHDLGLRPARSLD